MKLNRLFYGRHYGRVLIVTIIMAILYAWGWHQCNIYNKGIPLSRAGALVTFVLLLYGLSARIQLLDDAFQYVCDVIDRSVVNKKATEVVRTKSKKIVENRTERHKGIIKGWHLISMLLATMVWGFGDTIYVIISDPTMSLSDRFLRLITLQ
jgi:hypothetical protein